MLYDIFYIITPGSIQGPAATTAGNILALATDASAASLEQCFKVATELPAHTSFCLFVQNTTTITPEAGGALTAFFFFVNYYKQGNTPVVLTDADAAHSTGILEQEAIGQGFEKLHVLLPQVLAYAANTAPLIQQHYSNMLQSAVPAVTALYITVASPVEMAAMDKILEAEESRFEQETPALYLLKQQNRQLRIQVQQWERVALAAQQEIINQKEHNHILRSTSQATALQNYYNNEYEVLPLWFKRLGHIVKVLTGKRRLGSLFNDNVKKYKE
jgi:hypothetical protein